MRRACTAPSALCRRALTWSWALAQEVTTGRAEIITTIEGRTPQRYEVEIEKIALNASDANRNMVVHVTDPVLLQNTGGIVQGMSGSPHHSERQAGGRCDACAGERPHARLWHLCRKYAGNGRGRRGPPAPHKRAAFRKPGPGDACGHLPGPGFFAALRAGLGVPPGFGPAGTGLRAFPNALRKPGANHLYFVSKKRKESKYGKISLEAVAIYGNIW